jgi:signal peptidase II
VKNKFGFLILLSLILVTLDQLVKMYVHANFQLGESIPVIEGYFNITYVRNYGAAFGFLSDSHPSFREAFFLAMPPIAMLIILGVLKGVPSNDRLQILALTSVFGGAIGNYIDRVRFRYVIDYLDFHWNEKYTWPAFNVADMSIVFGVSLLLLLMFLEEKRNRKVSPKSA